jgi:hypothetical protein
MPLAPVRRVHVEPLARLRLHPAADNTPAGEDQRMGALRVEDGQFEIAIEGCCRDFAPHTGKIGRLGHSGIEIDHIPVDNVSADEPMPL